MLCSSSPKDGRAPYEHKYVRLEGTPHTLLACSPSHLAGLARISPALDCMSSHNILDGRSLLLLGAGAALGVGACWLVSSAHSTSRDTVRTQSGTIASTTNRSAEASDSKNQSASALSGLAGAGAGAGVSVSRFQEDEVLTEQLTRNVQFFGLEGQQRIADAYVVIVGLGVSSTCAHMLQAVICRYISNAVPSLGTRHAGGSDPHASLAQLSAC